MMYIRKSVALLLFTLGIPFIIALSAISMMYLSLIGLIANFKVDSGVDDIVSCCKAIPKMYAYVWHVGRVRIKENRGDKMLNLTEEALYIHNRIKATPLQQRAKFSEEYQELKEVFDKLPSDPKDLTVLQALAFLDELTDAFIAGVGVMKKNELPDAIIKERIEKKIKDVKVRYGANENR